MRRLAPGGPVFAAAWSGVPVPFVVVAFALLLLWAMWIVGLPALVGRLVRSVRRDGERSIADEAQAWLSRQ